jgi:hypothetical protein
MVAPRRRIGPSRLLLVILLAALAVGVAASVLVAARTAGPPPPVGPTHTILLPNWLIAAPLVGFVLVVIGMLVYDRWSNGAAAIPGRYIATALTIILLLVVFVEVAHLLAPSTIPGAASPTPNGNTTVPPTNQTTSNLTSNGSSVLSPTPHAPSWLPFVVVTGVAVLIAVVGVPSLFQYLQERRDERWSKRAQEEAKRALEDALGQAERDLEGGKEPREVILALYARLLAQLRPLATDVDHQTAEEIRARHLVRLGVRVGAAEALTRLFEEARYSTHPIGPADVARASAAIRDAQDDLRRALVTP